MVLQLIESRPYRIICWAHCLRKFDEINTVPIKNKKLKKLFVKIYLRYKKRRLLHLTMIKSLKSLFVVN